MSLNERPGVYSTYEVTSSVRGYASGAVVGIVAKSGKGTDLGCVKVTSRAAAIESFGEGALSEMCSLALRNGASAVYAHAVADSVMAANYTAGFTELCAIEGISIMSCDSRAAEVHAAMREAILGASESFRYRIGIVEALGTAPAAVSAAQAINCERMVLCRVDSQVQAGYCAAALAGAVAATTDPALPINGAELLGVSMSGRYSDEEINTMVRGGVTVLEQSAGALCVLRAVTTRSQTGGVSDATWRELTTIRIIDEVIPGIRDALRRRFSRAKNTEQTRGAIRTQVVIELQDRLLRQIIDGYGDVTAAASEADSTVCEVAFEFTVAHGLNHIQLMAKITV